MADTLIISGWPSADGCISWSQDNIIAIGTKTEVTLLVPLHNQLSDSDPKWKTVILDAGSFTQEECQNHEANSWSSWSIGEELSEREVIGLEWSPAGLGLFGRPLLAVHTANGVLSLWECCGRPVEKTSWNRACILNNVIPRSRPLKQSNGKSKRDSTTPRRVRSFCWSHPLHNHNSTLSGHFLQIENIAYLMAISDDSGQLELLVIHSPRGVSFSEDSKWSFSITGGFDATSLPNIQSSIFGCLPATTQGLPPLLDDLTWGRWSLAPDGSLVSILACTVNTRLHLFRIRNDHEATELTCSRVGNSKLTELADTLCAPPTLFSAPLLYDLPDELLIVTSKAFHRITIPMPSCNPVSVVTLTPRLPGSQRISSVVAASRDVNQLTAVVTSYGSTVQSNVQSLEVSAEGHQWSEILPVAKAFRKYMADYLEKSHMTDEIIARVRAAALSPRGDLIAVCASVHPKEGFEYTIETKQELIVALTRQRPLAQSLEFAQPTAYNSSADGITHLLREILALESADEWALLQDAFTSSGMDIFGGCESSLVLLTSDLNRALNSFRNRVMIGGEATESRAGCLLDCIADTASDDKATPDLDIVEILSSAVCDIDRSTYASSGLSQIVHDFHGAVLETLLARQQNGEDQLSQPRSQSSEPCPTCGDNMKFESLHWSQCENGHQFDRCGLTLLSIGTSELAKRCGICGIQYLNESKMAALQDSSISQGTNGTAVPEPLLYIMFHACTVCIYCGGRFVAS